MFVRIIIVLSLLASAAYNPTLAATSINELRPLNMDGQVSVDNLKGRIVVRVWAQPQVRITGSLGNGVEKLLIEGDAHSLSIEVKNPNQNGGWFSWGSNSRGSEPSIIEVMVPARASIVLETVSADVDVQGVAGRKLSVEGVSGDVLVASSSPGEASFESVSGDLDLRLTTGKISVDSVSGDTTLRGGLNGEVSIDSVSGNTTIITPALNRFTLSTVSGDADLKTDLKANGVLNAESLSGTLKLVLPKTISARLHAETFSGDITSPTGQVVKEDFGPGKTLDSRLGNGQGELKLETFSGDIRIELQ